MLINAEKHKGKIVLCFALLQEARPWIDYLKAKQSFQKRNISFYDCDDFSILISGIGTANMSVAIGWLFGKYNYKKIALYNIGCCGGAAEFLHQWFCITAVKDELSAKVFYPEIDFEKLPFNKLLTSTKPNTSIDIEKAACLVDMEAYAFAKAAQNFVSSSQIQVIKWVSDNGDLSFYKNEDWINVYKEKIPELCLLIKAQAQKLFRNFEYFYEGHLQLLEAIQLKLQLSFTQKQQIEDAIIFARKNLDECKAEQILKQMPNEKMTKLDRNKWVEKIINELRTI